MEYEVESGESVNYAVICAVSAFENRPPTELPPLQTTVDTDSLDSIFQTQRDEIQVSFSYSDSYVTVINTGRIRVSSQPERVSATGLQPESGYPKDDSD